MLKMFNQIYNNLIAESIFNEENFPVKFTYRPVELYVCIKTVEKVPKEFGSWPGLQQSKCFYVSPLPDHEVKKAGSIIGVNEIVLLRWTANNKWNSGPKKLSWESYDFLLPDFKPLIDNNYVQKVVDVNPAVEFILNYLSDNHFNMWKATVKNNFDFFYKNDENFQKLVNACRDTHAGREYAGHDFEDLLNL